MSNAKTLQSECTTYYISKPKLKFQKTNPSPFYLSSCTPTRLTFAPLLPHNLNMFSLEIFWFLGFKKILVFKSKCIHFSHNFYGNRFAYIITIFLHTL